MKFNYTLNKKQYEKLVYKANKGKNTYLLYISLFSYLYFVRNLILDNFLLVFVFYILLLIIMYLILNSFNYLLSKVISKISGKKLNIKYGTYRCELNDEKLVEKIDDFEIVINLKDIRKTKLKNNLFLVYTDKIMLIFSKPLFEKESEFYSLIDYLKKGRK